jgi:hypothetical protein
MLSSMASSMRSDRKILRMRIAIDLDGVLYNFTASLSDYIGHAVGQWYPYRPSCWEFYETDWGMSLAEYLAWFEQGVNASWIFVVGAPAKGSIEALHALIAKGHTIHLITDRNVGEKAKVNTALWLNAYGVPYDTLTFSNGSKASLIKVDLAVDDRPKLVDEYRAAGVEAYCMGFDERKDMKANKWYIPYDWDNFQLIAEGTEQRYGAVRQPADNRTRAHVPPGGARPPARSYRRTRSQDTSMARIAEVECRNAKLEALAKAAGNLNVRCHNRSRPSRDCWLCKLRTALDALND